MSEQVDIVKLEYYDKWLLEAKKILLKNIDNNEYALFVYGSMAENPLKAHDLDIGILGKKRVPAESRLNALDELEESIVPFRVDLIDFYDVDENFKKIALEKIIIWNKPKNINLN